MQNLVSISFINKMLGENPDETIHYAKNATQIFPAKAKVQYISCIWQLLKVSANKCIMWKGKCDLYKTEYLKIRIFQIEWILPQYAAARGCVHDVEGGGGEEVEMAGWWEEILGVQYFTRWSEFKFLLYQIS